LQVVHDLDIPPEAKQLIQRNAFTDQTRFQDFEVNSWLRNLVINSLNRDLVISSLLGAGVVLDPRHSELLSRKQAKSANSTVDENTAVVRHLLSVAVPNFDDMPLEQVIEVRHDKLWGAFRTFGREVVSDVTTDPDVLTDNRAFEETVGRRVERALFEELQKKYPNARSLIIDLGLGLLGLIPGLSIPTTVADAAKSIGQYWGGRGGWHAFLMKLERSR
jgi:hypothetical protein